ncbi:hypothetical protein J1N35_025634, partial [Gossypium stocksii]
MFHLENDDKYKDISNVRINLGINDDSDMVSAFSSTVIPKEGFNSESTTGKVLVKGFGIRS